jgi:hypothetical protein
VGDDGLGDLALHDLPARPLLGAFVGSLVGSVVVGLIIYAIKVSALKIPGEKATDVAIVLYAIPGALIGIALGDTR